MWRIKGFYMLKEKKRGRRQLSHDYVLYQNNKVKQILGLTLKHSDWVIVLLKRNRGIDDYKKDPKSTVASLIHSY